MYTAFSKLASRQLNELPPKEIWASSSSWKIYYDNDEAHGVLFVIWRGVEKITNYMMISVGKCNNYAETNWLMLTNFSSWQNWEKCLNQMWGWRMVKSKTRRDPFFKIGDWDLKILTKSEPVSKTVHSETWARRYSKIMHLSMSNWLGRGGGSGAWGGALTFSQKNAVKFPTPGQKCEVKYNWNSQPRKWFVVTGMNSKTLQMPYPWAKAINQIPALCPTSPPSPHPAGLTLIITQINTRLISQEF